MSETDLLNNYLNAAEAASPGPWYANIDDTIGGYAVGTAPGPVSVNREAAHVGSFIRDSDAEFIALSRELGPALARLVKLYRERSQRHAEVIDKIRSMCVVAASEAGSENNDAAAGLALDILDATFPLATDRVVLDSD